MSGLLPNSDPKCSFLSSGEIRSLFPITEHLTYLYNGNVAPCSTPVRMAIDEFVALWVEKGDAQWEAGFAAFDDAKKLFAGLVSGQSENVCSVTNTSSGINLAARIIAPPPGSNIVVDELSHMSNVYPWLQLRANGVEVRMARASDGRVAIDEMSRLCDQNTAAIDVCHVSMANGFRFDLHELCALAQSVEAALVVDAAQSAGAVGIDLKATPVDFIVAPTFKWLLGPMGAGFMHIGSKWIEREFPPPMAGWLAVTNPGDNDLSNMRLHSTAMRFEQGSLNTIGFVGARAGLELLHRVGPDWAYARIASLAERMYRGLDDLASLGVRLTTPPDPSERAGIVAFDAPNRAELHGHLQDERIHVGDWLGNIRIDPSFYNSEAEVDRCLGEVAVFLADRSRSSRTADRTHR